MAADPVNRNDMRHHRLADPFWLPCFTLSVNTETLTAIASKCLDGTYTTDHEETAPWGRIMGSNRSYTWQSEEDLDGAPCLHVKC